MLLAWASQYQRHNRKTFPWCKKWIPFDERHVVWISLGHTHRLYKLYIFHNKYSGRFMISIPMSLKIIWESESVLFLISLWTVKIISWNWAHSGSMLGIYHSYLTQGISLILREWELAWPIYFCCSNSRTKGKDLLTWIIFH